MFLKHILGRLLIGSCGILPRILLLNSICFPHLSDCLDYSTFEKEILFYKSIAKKFNIPVIIFVDSRHIEINTESKENIKTEEVEFVLIKPSLTEINI